LDGVDFTGLNLALLSVMPMRQLNQNEMLRGWSASGQDLRAQLWPEPEKPKSAEVKDKKTWFGHHIWGALAYIFVALFAGASSVAGGLVSTKQIESIYSYVGDKLEDVLG
jgi:hypothetical protein